MANISDVNQELVRAFNVNLRFNGIALTNLTVQNLHDKDHIVISFDKNMDSKKCIGYLNDLRERIIKKSYKNEKAAGISYNLQSFPFVFHKESLDKDKRFSVVIDEGVIFNLKCYLAQALVGDVIEKTGSKFGLKYIRERIYDANFNKDSYLYCMLFRDKNLQKYFVNSFLAEIGDYENAPSNYLEVNDNLIYIKKGIFDNVEFIKSIVEYNSSLECRYLRTPSTEKQAVDKLKHMIIDFIDRAADIPVRTIIRTSYTESNENSVLIPLTQYGKFLKSFTEDDVNNLNHVFGRAIVTGIESHRLKNPYWKNDYIYAIDFSDWDVSYCVMNKILENSIINKDYELTIDPELYFRALSPEPQVSPEKKSGILSLSGCKLSASKSTSTSSIYESELSDSEIERQTPLTSSKREKLYSVLSPEMKEKLKSSCLSSEEENLLYLTYFDKRGLDLSLIPGKEESQQLQLPQPVGESENCNSQVLSSSDYGSKPLPESSLDSVNLAKQGQKRQKDLVH